MSIKIMLQLLLLLLSLFVSIPQSFVQCKPSNDYENVLEKRERRMTNAEPVPEGRWPFMASIIITDLDTGETDIVCSGEILTDYLILTAAHCIAYPYELIHGLLKVAFGAQPLISPLLTIRIESVAIHPFYDPWSLMRDIGIIKLANRIPTHLFFPVLPIHIIYNSYFTGTYDIRNYVYGNFCIVLGYGPPTPQSPRQDRRLRQLNMPLLTNETCRTTHPFVNLFEDIFCASNQHEFLAGQPPFKTVTEGDSGGAIICPLRVFSVFRIGLEIPLNHFLITDYALVGILSGGQVRPIRQLDNNQTTYIEYATMTNVVYYGDFINLHVFHFVPTSNQILAILYQQSLLKDMFRNSTSAPNSRRCISIH